MPRLVDHEQRRLELVAATWRVVAEEGIEAATLRRIADSAGCTTGLLTHYFDTREDVLVAALRHVHAAAAARMRRVRERDRGLTALRGVALESLPLDRDRVLEWKVWLAFWGRASTSPPLLAEQRHRYAEWIRLIDTLLHQSAELGELSHQPDRTILRDQLIATIDGLGLQAVLEPTRLKPARLVQVVDAVLAGMSEATSAQAP